jgi:hypothetical protein
MCNGRLQLTTHSTRGARSETLHSKSPWATSTPSLPNAPSWGGCVCDMTLLCAVLCHVCALFPFHLHSVRESPTLIQRLGGGVRWSVLSCRIGKAPQGESHGLLLNPKDVPPGVGEKLALPWFGGGSPLHGAPQLPPCAGAYPSWKELGMLNHLPGLSGPVERPYLSS